MTSPQWLCAYVITRNGIGEFDLDPAPWLIGHRELGIVVGEVEPAVFEEIDPKDPADGGLVQLARRHDEVVRAVFGRAPVLPLRFGTILAGADAALRLLKQNYAQAERCLSQVEGHREWGVRARLAGAAPPRTDLTGLTGTEYLTLRRERLTQARRSRQSAAEAAGLLHQALRRHATRSAERARAHGVLADTAYLVCQDRESQFHNEIDRLSGALDGSGVQIETTGPWPPYSFADIELGRRVDA